MTESITKHSLLGLVEKSPAISQWPYTGRSKDCWFHRLVNNMTSSAANPDLVQNLVQLLDDQAYTHFAIAAGLQSYFGVGIPTRSQVVHHRSGLCSCPKGLGRIEDA